MNQKREKTNATAILFLSVGLLIAPVLLAMTLFTNVAQAKLGHPQRYDVEYRRCGVANIFMFTEPLGGWKFIILRNMVVG